MKRLLPHAMRIAPALDEHWRPRAIDPRRVLLVNPFYPKDPHASFGERVLWGGAACPVLPEELEVLDRPTAAQRAACEVQNVSGFMVGHVRSRHAHTTIDALAVPGLLRELVSDADAA